jgi:hypothetical protein
MPLDYQIPDDPDSGQMDAAYLRSIFGLRTKVGEEPAPLPDAVRRAHYDVSRPLRVLGAMGSGMTPDQLALVTVLAVREGQAIKEADPQYSFLDETPEAGQKVVVHWRLKERPAHFMGTSEGRVVVLLDGNEVKIRPDLVRFPTEGEFPEVADNCNSLTTGQ